MSEQAKIIVPIYAEKCSICTYMNPRAKKTFKCHYSKGNSMCPASTYVFAVGFSPVPAADRFKKALLAGDVDGMQKVLLKVKEQPEAVQTEFFELTGQSIAREYEEVDREPVSTDELAKRLKATMAPGQDAPEAEAGEEGGEEGEGSWN